MFLKAWLSLCRAPSAGFPSVLWRRIGTSSSSYLLSITTSFTARFPATKAWPAAINGSTSTGRFMKWFTYTSFATVKWSWIWTGSVPELILVRAGTWTIWGPARPWSTSTFIVEYNVWFPYAGLSSILGRNACSLSYSPTPFTVTCSRIPRCPFPIYGFSCKIELGSR